MTSIRDVVSLKPLSRKQLDGILDLAEPCEDIAGGKVPAEGRH